MNHLIPATATKTADTCWIAMSESDEAGTTIFGVYLDEQQALAAAAQQQGKEHSDMVRNMSTYGAQRTSLIYPRGAAR
jgi:hypothetical protein